MVDIDRNVPPRHDVALWNETRWTGCWNPDDGVGLYIHAGRFRRDLDMWWAQVAAYLPDGKLCVDRLWGRNLSPAGVRVGGLELAITEDGWTSTLDAVGQLTSTAELSRRPRGDSAPSRSLRWDVRAVGATPVWDMYAGRAGERLTHAGDAHVQQGLHTAGTLRVGEDEYPLDGIGFSDHSSGPRRFDSWVGHRFLLIVAPEWTAHLLVMETSEGGPVTPWGVFFRGAEKHDITRFELPPLTHADGAPARGPLLFTTSAGETFEFDTELVHALPICITPENDNINGIDWDLPGDPVVCIEGKGELTAPDGTVVHAYFERSARRSALKR